MVVYKSDGDLNEQGHERAVGSPGIEEYTERECYWTWLGEQLTHNKPGWGDDEGRHGSSKWC